MSTSQFWFSRKVLLSLLFVLICLPTAGLAQSVKQNADSDKADLMHFEFKDASLKSVLKNLCKQVGIDVVYEVSVKDIKVTFKRDDITMKTMIKDLLAEQHLQARMTEATRVTIFADTEENRSRYESYTVWPEENTTNEELNLLRFNDVSARNSVSSLAQELGFQLVFDQSVQDERLNLVLWNVSGQKALEILLFKQKWAARILNQHTLLISAATLHNQSHYAGLRTWYDSSLLPKLSCEQK